MQTLHARHVVLGAGAMGSAAAYHLARRGEPVLLIEQFRLGHDRGSSHGAARITRHSYADERYARLMPEAFRAWRELEADAGRPLYIRTGGVSFGPPGVDYVARVAACLEAIGVPHRRMSGRALREALPAFEVPDDYDAVFEPDAGLISAAQAVAVEVELARRHGGERTTVLDECPVLRLDLDAERPTLLTARHRITADRLIVTAGPWAGRLLPALGARLNPTRQQVCYFAPADRAPFVIGRFPVFIYMGEGDHAAFYGMPDYLGGGVKVARHGGPACDPDAVDRGVDAEAVRVVREFLRGHIPSLADAPIAATEVCLYTMAPGEDFLVGPWSGRPDVIVASPCSGHGFKFSNLIGRILAGLAVLGRSDPDVSAWRTFPEK
jgi:sarcosine oxidase